MRFGKSLSRVALTGLALAALSLPAAPGVAAPVVWEFNGHAYEYVQMVGVSWEDAKAHAEGLSVENGDVGYLATINSVYEQEFIQSAVLPNIGVNKNQVWIGGRQDAEEGLTTPAANWNWVVNVEVAPESWSYTNWLAEHEPSNDGNIDERFLTMWVKHLQNGQDGRGKWNDEKLIAPTTAQIIGMIVEYSLPEPGTAGLVALGAALLALRSRRA
jgi:hypothetical protein